MNAYLFTSRSQSASALHPRSVPSLVPRASIFCSHFPCRCHRSSIPSPSLVITTSPRSLGYQIVGPANALLHPMIDCLELCLSRSQLSSLRTHHWTPRVSAPYNAYTGFFSTFPTPTLTVTVSMRLVSSLLCGLSLTVILCGYPSLGSHVDPQLKCSDFSST